MLPGAQRTRTTSCWARDTASPPSDDCSTTTSGIILFDDVGAGPGQQTVPTASYGANRLGSGVGEFIHVNLGQADDEYVQVLVADSHAQTFTAVFAKRYSTGANLRPTI